MPRFPLIPSLHHFIFLLLLYRPPSTVDEESMTKNAPAK